uniref:Uncharacterized protein n=1 Tax=Knipowitschia caucasica TaxID=637954 RepID=A0AAV2JHR1_KNICA
MSNLYMSDLYMSDLYMSDLYMANLYMSDLYMSDLYMTDLYMSDLYMSDLYMSDLYMTDLYMSDLKLLTSLLNICSLNYAESLTDFYIFIETTVYNIDFGRVKEKPRVKELKDLKCWSPKILSKESGQCLSVSSVKDNIPVLQHFANI